MADTEKKIVEAIGSALPLLSETEKAQLLGFGEGMAFMAREKAEEATTCLTEST